MATWTTDDLLRLDHEYASAGVPLHQRPFRAALRLLGGGFVLGPYGNPEIKRITEAYAALIPEVREVWPGAGIGLVISVDQVRKFALPVAFGARRPIALWEALGFQSRDNWWQWCRRDLRIAAESSFAVADVGDLFAGIDRVSPSEALTLWRMAGSNLEDVSNALPLAFSVDSVTQPICLTVELALKGALVTVGADPKSFKGAPGHDLVALAKEVSRAVPHRDDALIAKVVARLPPYVQSRYSPGGLRRLDVVRLALGAQFIAASMLRRSTGEDSALQMEIAEWPGLRPELP